MLIVKAVLRRFLMMTFVNQDIKNITKIISNIIKTYAEFI